jgi:hypothetical protein
MADDPAAEGQAPAPGSPQASALAWLEAAMDRRDLAAAWAITDPTLRLVLAQEWMWRRGSEQLLSDGEERDAVAAALAASSEHALWDRFAAEVTGEWQRAWKGFSARTWRAWNQPEVVSLDLEMVTLVETGGAEVAGDPRRASFTRRFLVRHTADGWLVAGLTGEHVFRPGWPPAPE